MKANELRLGNIIKTSSEQVEVKAIYGNRILTQGKGPLALVLEDIRLYGVPLTKDYLLGKGFSSHFTSDPQEVGASLQYVKGIKIDQPDEDQDNFYFDNLQINFVHDLQNLYFALSKEEL